MKKFLAIVLVMAMMAAMTMTFSVVSPLKVSAKTSIGDANMDDTIDMKDVLIIRKYLAGMVEEYNLDLLAADCNQDASIDMKDVLMLRRYLAHMGDLPTEKTTTTKVPVTTTTKGGNVPSGPIDINHPRINFITGSPYTLGVWWWYRGLNEDHMKFLQENQCTEIYYECYPDLYGGTTSRATLHTFVQTAAKYGMRVAALFDDKTDALGEGVTWNKVIDGYKTYRQEYPDDDLYAIHCDIEPKGATLVSTYISKFIGEKVAKARAEGIKVELDLPCGWEGSAYDNMSLNGITGVYNIIANNCDCMCLMSYRDTMEALWSLAYNKILAGSQYNCKVVMGIELGVSGEAPSADGNVHADFSEESTYSAYNVLLQVIEKLNSRRVKDKVTCPIGFAVHSMASWINLRDNYSGDFE